MISVFHKMVKQTIKGQLKKLQLGYVRKKYAFSKEDLHTLLRNLGLQGGDVVLVHSSVEPFEGFVGRPTDVIAILQEIVGAEGTLLMPTLPFTGSAVEYATQASPFDAAKTPSRMGLITELFRRSPGVLRSVHLTHPVAAWGTSAEEIIAGHYLTATPCGRQSPYGKLLDRGGKILFLGTDMSVMTFFHMVEEMLEPGMPFSPFTEKVFSLASRDKSGNTLITNTRLFDPVYSRRRNLNKLVPVLKQRGQWKEGRVGKLGAILLNAEDVSAAAQFLAHKGIYCYEL